MRHRLHREHQGPALARRRRAGPDHSRQSGPPRRPRLRRRHGRRCRHPAPGAAPLPGRDVRRGRLRPARAERVRRGHGVSAAGRRPAPRLRTAVGGHRRRRRPDRAGLARRAHRRYRPGRLGQGMPALHPPDFRGPRRGAGRRPRIRAQAVRHPPPRHERHALCRVRRRRVFLRGQPVVPNPDLQRHADAPPSEDLLSRPVRPAHRERDRPRPLALQHQHLSELGALAPLPLRDPQRRDQHAARQRELDARPRVADGVRGVRRRPAESLSRPAGRRQRLRDLRQLPGIPRPVRPPAVPRHDDDDPRAVGKVRGHGRRQAGVLRIPQLPDGAVGRPGLHRVHGRDARRRGARPQRAAAVALLRDEGRPGRHGLRGRRAGRAGRPRAGEAPPAARPHVPGRYRAGPHRQRRGIEARRRDGPAVPRLARPPHRVFRPAAGGGGPPARTRPRSHAAAPARLRLQLRGSQDQHRPDGAEQDPAHRLHGHRHAAGRAVRQAAAFVQLLQAVVRAGDEPAHRPDPRGTRHRDHADARPRGQPARTAARRLPADPAADSDPEERGLGDAARHRPAGLRDRHAAHPVRPDAGRSRLGRRPGRAEPRRGRRDCGRRHDPDPVGHGRGRRPCRHSGAAGRVRAASPPDPLGRPDPGRAGTGIRRAPRGAPLLPAARLRRAGHQPLPGVCLPRRHDRRGHAARRGVRGRGRRLRQGRGQRHRQGHVQDGHFDDQVLLRRADLRGGRAQAVPGRTLLHVDPVAC